jgi:hypothetical protein
MNSNFNPHRRKFLKYAAATLGAAALGYLGYDLVNSSLAYTPSTNRTMTSLTGLPTSSTSEVYSTSSRLYTQKGRLFFDKGTSTFGTAGDGIQSDPEMEPGEPNAQVLFTDLQQNSVGAVNTDSAGDFSIDLPAGEYQLTPVVNNPKRAYSYMCQSVDDCTPLPGSYNITVGESNPKLSIGLLQGFLSFPQKGVNVDNGGFYNRDPRPGNTLAWNGQTDEASNADSGTHFLAEYGDPIPSYMPGTVTGVYPDTPDNWLVISSDFSPFWIGYAHNSEILVSKGDKVARYQPVAKAGNRGYVDRTLVHLQLSSGNDVIDPYKPIYPFNTVPYGAWTANCSSNDCLHASWIALDASNPINWKNYWIVEDQTHY